MPGFMERLQEKLNAPVMVGKPFENLMWQKELEKTLEERKKTEKANAETIENVKSFFKERNYEENSKTSLLVKKSFF